ncbi:MAG: hypothetical protein R3D45_05090 [Rhizobiaceae bacterium]
MTDQSLEISAGLPVTLEAVELELALQMQDIVSNGFEDSVQNAVEAAGYNFLFQFPAGRENGHQRVAAISAGRGDERQILLVHLAEDGETLRVEAPDDKNRSIARFAASYAGLMDCLGSTGAAA